MLAHVAGMPLEETALGLMPVAALGLGGVLAGALRLLRSLPRVRGSRRGRLAR
ncbi:MAG TPA: hypothetical protein VFJ61_10875 [Solirubrobacterales bacterium]|nr:hypothetical protein [Solirubrobacterales bacterium]